MPKTSRFMTMMIAVFAAFAFGLAGCDGGDKAAAPDEHAGHDHAADAEESAKGGAHDLKKMAEEAEEVAEDAVDEIAAAAKDMKSKMPTTAPTTQPGN